MIKARSATLVQVQKETKYDPAIIRKRGSKQSHVGFPEMRPEFPASVALVAILTGQWWEYGIDVSTDAAYSRLVAQKRATGTNILHVDLFTVNVGDLPLCEQIQS